MGIIKCRLTEMNQILNNLLTYRFDNNNERITISSIRRARKDICTMLDADYPDTDSSCTEHEIALVNSWFKEAGLKCN